MNNKQALRLSMVIPFLLVGILIGQRNFLVVGDAFAKPGDTGISVGIQLVNEDTLGGLQFTLVFDEASIVVDTVVVQGRLSGDNLFTNSTAPGEITVIVADLSGGSILPGAGSVLRFEFSVSSGASMGAHLLDLDEVVFSDTSGSRVTASSVDGYFVIPGDDVLRMGNGYFSNPLQLHNTSTLEGVQFTLDYDAALFSIDTILTTPRSSHMTLQYSEPQVGAAIVLLYKNSADVISAGSGSILEIRFGHVQDSTSTINLLRLTDVTLASSGGSVLAAQIVDGYYFIHENLIPAVIVSVNPTELILAVRTLVTLTGNNLQGATAVTIDREATVDSLTVSIDGTQLSAYLTVDAGQDTGQATITVHTPQGNPTVGMTLVALTVSVRESNDIPAEFSLIQNYPNPFNPNTTLWFDLPEAVDLSLVIYDLMGREISRLVEGQMEAGYHQVMWNGQTATGQSVTTGIYIARLVTPSYTRSIKMVLLK